MDVDLVVYVLNRLSYDVKDISASFYTKDFAVTFDDLHEQLIEYDSYLKWLSLSFVTTPITAHVANSSFTRPPSHENDLSHLLVLFHRFFFQNLITLDVQVLISAKANCVIRLATLPNFVLLLNNNGHILHPVLPHQEAFTLVNLLMLIMLIPMIIIFLDNDPLHLVHQILLGSLIRMLFITLP